MEPRLKSGSAVSATAVITFKASSRADASFYGRSIYNNILVKYVAFSFTVLGFSDSDNHF